MAPIYRVSMCPRLSQTVSLHACCSGIVINSTLFCSKSCRSLHSLPTNLSTIPTTYFTLLSTSFQLLVEIQDFSAHKKLKLGKLMSAHYCLCKRHVNRHVPPLSFSHLPLPPWSPTPNFIPNAFTFWMSVEIL